MAHNALLVFVHSVFRNVFCLLYGILSNDVFSFMRQEEDPEDEGEKDLDSLSGEVDATVNVDVTIKYEYSII